MLPAGLLFLFRRSYLTCSCKKRMVIIKEQCLSNDSTVLISVLLCMCKEFHIVYNCYQFDLVYL